MVTGGKERQGGNVPGEICPNSSTIVVETIACSQ